MSSPAPSRRSRTFTLLLLMIVATVLVVIIGTGAYAWRRHVAIRRIVDAGNIVLFASTPKWMPRWVASRIPDCLDSVDEIEFVKRSKDGIINRSEDGLREVGVLRELRFLNLGGTEVTEAGMSALRNCHRLEQLDLSGTGVDDACLRHLRRIPLHGLNLSLTNVTDAGMESLKDIRTLRILIIANTRVTDAGVKALAPLMLEHFGLKGTQMTDDGLRALESRKGTLTSITLSSPGVNRHSAVKFARLLGMDLDISLENFDLGKDSFLECTGEQGLCAEDLTELRLDFPHLRKLQTSGPEHDFDGTIFHIRDWSFLPVEKFGCWRLPGEDFDLTQEELSWQYAPPVADVCTLQSQQADALEWLCTLGMRSLWYEGLTERSVAVYDRNARRIPDVKTIRQLRLGAPARPSGGWRLHVLPLDDEDILTRMAAGENSETLREEREDAMVRRLLAAPHKVATVVLSGDHDLRDNLDRLGGQRWQLVTIDVKAYDRLVNGPSQDHE